MQKVFDWTGGQPFLTQKLCQIIVDYADDSQPDIDKLVEEHILTDWEEKDNPTHLKYISNYLLTDTNNFLGRSNNLLRLYQTILQKGEVKADSSRVQMALRLSGIVLKKRDKLVIFNKIYRTIFNRDWVQEQLVNIESDRENDRENTTIFNISICPYMGLQAFRQQDAKFFFGRQKLTREILAKLQNSSFLAVVGASGSGKSSVVQAGVLPRLAAGEYPPGEYWCGCFPPGATPMNALAQVLASDGKVDDVERSLHLGAEWLVWWLRCREEPMVALVVDQFEELFTSSGEKNWTDDKKRLEFLDLLLGALQEASDKLKLIITLWDDFIDLSKLKNGNQILTSTQILRK